MPSPLGARQSNHGINFTPASSPPLYAPSLLPPLPIDPYMRVNSHATYHAQLPRQPSRLLAPTFEQYPPFTRDPVHSYNPQFIQAQPLPNDRLIPQPLLNNTTTFQPNNSSLLKPSLPSTKDIPKLTGKNDWGPWHQAVTDLIANQQVYDHISDGLVNGARFEPSFIPTYPPDVHQNSSQAELAAYNTWWAMDGLAAHVLLSRLSESVLNSIPRANPLLGQRRSARDIMASLRQNYGAGDYSAASAIENKIRGLTCSAVGGNPGLSVADFISLWRSHTNQMSASGYPLPSRQLLQLFADGLP
ncbi:hypothetical protein GALMADRAFT_79643, partial [Galerina marginata CBS 339.88]